MIGLFTSVVALKQILITSVVLKLGGVGPLGGLEPLQGGGGGILSGGKYSVVQICINMIYVGKINFISLSFSLDCFLLVSGPTIVND